MESDMTQENPSVSAKIIRITYFGEWAASLALLMMVALLAYIFYQLTTQTFEITDDIRNALELGAEFNGFSGFQTGAILAVQLTSLMLGMVMIFTIRRLFIGIRKIGVFVPQTARRLRIIGWVIIAMAPVSILSEFVVYALVQMWANSNLAAMQLSFDDTDVYAIVIGLVLVVVGHIMLEAIRIYDENGAFV
ncbi:MAG TPA: DUF2975 domain-containing protein [Rhodobacteraceae bacterium]|nr:DUF2975 domain-containing protein [Paracoccaceae bacterium]